MNRAALITIALLTIASLGGAPAAAQQSASTETATRLLRALAEAEADYFDRSGQIERLRRYYEARNDAAKVADTDRAASLAEEAYAARLDELRSRYGARALDEAKGARKTARRDRRTTGGAKDDGGDQARRPVQRGGDDLRRDDGRRPGDKPRDEGDDIGPGDDRRKDDRRRDDVGPGDDRRKDDRRRDDVGPGDDRRKDDRRRDDDVGPGDDRRKDDRRRDDDVGPGDDRRKDDRRRDDDRDDDWDDDRRRDDDRDDDRGDTEREWAEMEAEYEREMAQIDAEFDREMAQIEAELDRELAEADREGKAEKADRAFAKFEGKRDRLIAKMEEKHARRAAWLENKMLAIQERERVEICWSPTGDPEERRTRTVTRATVESYLEMGATLGSCDQPARATATGFTLEPRFRPRPIIPATQEGTSPTGAPAPPQNVYEQVLQRVPDILGEGPAADILEVILGDPPPTATEADRVLAELLRDR